MADSKVPSEWGHDSWNMLRQPAYKELSASPAFPDWLRVVYAAYGNLAANGHARFAQKELAHLLGETVDGVWVPADRRSVHKAIRRAIDKGLLVDGSKGLCLIVPRSMMVMGKGDADAPCVRHPRRQSRRGLVAVS